MLAANFLKVLIRLAATSYREEIAVFCAALRG
jgi:hypothetical protein